MIPITPITNCDQMVANAGTCELAPLVSSLSPIKFGHQIVADLVLSFQLQ